jgi:hypothetical protein
LNAKTNTIVAKYNHAREARERLGYANPDYHSSLKVIFRCLLISQRQTE